MKPSRASESLGTNVLSFPGRRSSIGYMGLIVEGEASLIPKVWASCVSLISSLLCGWEKGQPWSTSSDLQGSLDLDTEQKWRGYQTQPSKHNSCRMAWAGHLPNKPVPEQEAGAKIVAVCSSLRGEVRWLELEQGGMSILGDIVGSYSFENTVGSGERRQAAEKQTTASLIDQRTWRLAARFGKKKVVELEPSSSTCCDHFWAWLSLCRQSAVKATSTSSILLGLGDSAPGVIALETQRKKWLFFLNPQDVALASCLLFVSQPAQCKTQVTRKYAYGSFVEQFDFGCAVVQRDQIFLSNLRWDGRWHWKHY